MSQQQQPNNEGNGGSKLVLRRIAIRASFRANSAPPGVADFISSTPYEHKGLLRNTMSGMFDDQIPLHRPEWWIVQHDDDIKGLALVSYTRLNGEGLQEFVGVEHLLVAKDYRNKGVGSLIILTLQKLARKRKDLGGVNLESEVELLQYYSRFGFVKRAFQSGAFVKLIWRS